ncbi:MAG: ammonia-forming cytochrome c nitrite reductase [Bacteroidetes bacterium HGW-Bacteroidetes-8]|jgi:nitrite reductase (cytochrome c-552)|nr:MAG: ammonia-forming cytochrome c nitrite reductase [Bacteroidetes bacterium HGW-Bacteroidetes-8]
MKLKLFFEKHRVALMWTLFAGTIVVVFLLGLLAASVTERRAEIATLFNNKRVEIKGIESRSEIWGENYPREYETWKKTKEMDFESKHNGNGVVDLLEQRPDMVVLWAGYAFSRDYSAPRGHSYAVEDVVKTLRTGAPVTEDKNLQPSTCWACKSPDVPRLMAEVGIEKFYSSKWSHFGSEVVNSIGCADCHNPENMNIAISRPALAEAFERVGKDIGVTTIQERRSLACAQCHVEYHFKGDGKYLTFPWDKGMSVEQIESYYDEIGFSDWVHTLSKAPMLKAQHPDYEIFMAGPHAQRGLSCADCHMPYKSDGAIKYSDHHVTSPLLNIDRTCQTCHRDSKENLLKYVYEYQDKILETRDRVEKELVKSHIAAKFAWDNGASQKQMEPVLMLIRAAQWRWDFAVASHGAAFHAPVETQRILAHSLDKSYQAQLETIKVLASLGIKDEIPTPDISTKERAQQYIGLDMAKLRREKDEFMTTTVPQWLVKARENGRLL